MISVIMPCLNEELAIGGCVTQALAALHAARLDGEVIVVDNGSTDDSANRAKRAGAHVVRQPMRGYGAACQTGMAASRGDVLVIGDGDGSYDFSVIPTMLRLLDHSDLVLGSRLRGAILPGAMPALHRWLGTPALTFLLNQLFGVRCSDAHTGLRALTRELYQHLWLTSTGMEFASEMIIEAVGVGATITELPITYFPRTGQSKLRALPDAWRHLHLMLTRRLAWGAADLPRRLVRR
ncbi:MAG: glycosyltransferase family 2 protein [Anaerolineae bacterium]|nr:glycosyltransferase family 2 protein [Anaerolineae bacterium]